ncbi:MAG: Receptor family ligand binding region [Pelotomaculum sp. PtaB.Bin104]|nr:MAG: Receptor family ligand binding region [Pelotomaculum sp. PtaB.Bin104]
MTGMEVTNPAGVVLLTPTASSSRLSGLDDYLFRVYPSSDDSVQAFIQYVYKRRGITRLAVIYDTDNAGFAESFSEKVKKSAHPKHL